jgi:cytochrome b561
MTSPSEELRLARFNGRADTWREDSPPRSGKLVALHWLTVLCLVVGVTLVLVRDQLDGRVVRDWLLEGHRHFGLFILVLFATRLMLRVRLGKLPSSHDHSPRLLRILAGLTHAILYALLLALPLLGWALSDAAGKPVDFFGIRLPVLVNPDEDLADSLETWHIDVAWLLLGVVSMHVAAALWHHAFLRDGVLRSMLPRRRR